MVFHWISGDSKSPLVSTTILNVLVDLNNAVVWMVSTRPLISNSLSSCTNYLVTVPSAPITIGIIDTVLIIIIHSFRVFHISVSWWFFTGVWVYSKSPQVSRNHLRILAVLSNAVVWIVSTRPPTFKSSRPFNNPLVIVPNEPITFGTIVNFMFHSFLSQGRGTYLSFHFSSDLFCGPTGQQSRQFYKFSFFLLIIMRSGLLARIRWSVCMLKSHYYYYYCLVLTLALIGCF